MFAALLTAVAFVGAVMAALSGAGIGSTLVPVFALHIDFKIAVAAAAAPHLVGSVYRAWRLRQHVDRGVLLRFGLVCAVASLAGALAHPRVASHAITYVFASLLVLAGALGLTGLSEKARLGRGGSWVAGAVSGFFGGLAGEQGGVRAVALLGFDLGKESFVATATAVGVLIDVVRMPVYLDTQWTSMRAVLPEIGMASAAVVAGTWVGAKLLGRVPAQLFRRLVSGIILAIGGLLFLHSPRS
jgi:uncharacterized membrane protein YfcA